MKALGMRSWLALGVSLLSLLGWTALSATGIRHGNFLFHQAARRPFLDLYEHFTDGTVLLGHGDIYQLRPFLNNSNPPVVTLLYLPLRALGETLSADVMIFLSLVALSATSAACLFRLGVARWSRAILVSSLFIVPLALVGCEPLRAMLKAGQIRGLLLLLVVVDLLVVPARRRGFLTGLAGAIAITPLAFAALVAFSAGRRALWRSLASFTAWTMLGLGVGWHAFFRYWLVLLPTGQQASRVLLPYPPGSDPYASRGQASLRALLARPPLNHLPAPWLIWGLLVLLLAGLSWWVVTRLSRAGLVVSATALFASSLLIIEPATWNHYWMWGLLAIPAAAECWPRTRGLALAGLLVPLVSLPPLTHVMNYVGKALVWPGAATGIYPVASVLWLLTAALVLRRWSGDESTPTWWG